jgi:hypothetical protein
VINEIEKDTPQEREAVLRLCAEGSFPAASDRDYTDELRLHEAEMAAERVRPKAGANARPALSDAHSLAVQAIKCFGASINERAVSKKRLCPEIPLFLTPA